MGKFNGVLIASDYDNTLVYTEDALKGLEPMPGLLPENREAIEYFMAHGGVFSVATGRALPSFDTVRKGVPMNGPTILFNGAAIYDFEKQQYLCTAFLPDTVRPHISQVLDAWPQAAVELYHDDNAIFALHPNELTLAHLHITHEATTMVDSLDQVPSPISKALFEIAPEHLEDMYRYVLAQPWASLYEVIPSSICFLELTAKGANKGGMVRRLSQLLHIAPEHVYCVGDHANDLGMLAASAIPFAPANAIEAVRRVPGVHLLPDARCGAIAEMIRQLDRRY
mgnify:FL=1